MAAELNITTAPTRNGFLSNVTARRQSEVLQGQAGERHLRLLLQGHAHVGGRLRLSHSKEVLWQGL